MNSLIEVPHIPVEALWEVSWKIGGGIDNRHSEACPLCKEAWSIDTRPNIFPGWMRKLQKCQKI